MTTHPWSLWLLPEEKDSLKLKRLINELSIENGSSSFEPHVTLFGRVSITPYLLFKFFEEQTVDQKQIVSEIKDLRLGSSPWRAMFLDIQMSEVLDSFQDRIIEKLNTVRNYEFDPHLSLVYCNKKATKVSIRGVSMPRTIRFESLAVVEVPNNIDEWNIIKEFKFNFNE